ncbi:uncharacterized protein [Primulina huaijiensis]
MVGNLMSSTTTYTEMGSSRIQSRGRKTNSSKSLRTLSNQGTAPSESQRAAISPPVSQHQSLSSTPFHSRYTLVSQRHPSSSQQEQSFSATKPPKSRSCSGNSITARARARAHARASASAKARENLSATASARTTASATASAMGSENVSAVANASCGGKTLM